MKGIGRMTRDLAMGRYSLLIRVSIAVNLRMTELREKVNSVIDKGICSSL